MLGLVLSHTKVANGYRVVLAPATRQADGQFVAIPGRAAVTYLIDPIEVTNDGQQVTALTIVGG